MKEVKLYLNYAGFCLAKESHAIKDGANKQIKFNALFAVIQHDTLGTILFDTGYTRRFYDATKSYPNKIYANLTKVEISEDTELITQLKNHGIDSTSVRHIIISHFHADHIGGLKDFEQATFYCSKKAYLHTKKMSGFFGFTKGILSDLIPEDFDSRVKFVEDLGVQKSDAVFGTCYDLFKDGTILTYDLPGHAAGQIGVRLKTKRQDYFLIADASWFSSAYETLKLPNAIVRTFFHSWRDYKVTIAKLNTYYKLNPGVKIVPTHCNETTSVLCSNVINFDAL